MRQPVSIRPPRATGGRFAVPCRKDAGPIPRPAINDQST